MTSPKTPRELTEERTRARAQALAEAVVAAFSERLKDEIGKHGGFLGLRHVDSLEAGFRAKAEQLAGVFAQAFDDALREQEELRWYSIKRPAFDRLIVKRFEHLFIHKGPGGRMQGTVSRRLLPGFFLALNMMLGPEALGEYQRRCDRAVERVMKGQLPVDWERVNQDGDVHDVILDAQLAIAGHFEDTFKRGDWFMHIVNSHMAPAGPGHHADEHWELGRRALHILVNSLLSDLKKAVSDTVAWRHLAERHADADRARLAAILERLD